MGVLTGLDGSQSSLHGRVLHANQKSFVGISESFQRASRKCLAYDGEGLEGAFDVSTSLALLVELDEVLRTVTSSDMSSVSIVGALLVQFARKGKVESSHVVGPLRRLLAFTETDAEMRSEDLEDVSVRVLICARYRIERRTKERGERLEGRAQSKGTQDVPAQDQSKSKTMRTFLTMLSGERIETDRGGVGG